MPLGCDDIRSILEGDFEEQIDTVAFERHLESCSRCAELYRLESDLEDALRLALPDPAPADLFSVLKKRLESIESINRLSKWPVFAMAIMTPVTLAVILFFAMKNIGVVMGSFPGFRPGEVIGRILDFTGRVNMPHFNLTQIEGYVSGAPLLAFTILAAAGAIFIFSVLELEKTLK